VATAALEGQATIIGDHAPPATPLPLHARQLLTTLPRIGHLDGFIAPLREALRQPAEITRDRRFLFLMACCLPAVFFAVMGFLGTVMLTDWQQKHPQIRPLHEHLSHLNAVEFTIPYLPETAQEKNLDQAKCLEVIIAHRFGDTIRDQKEWDSAYARTIPPRQRKRGEQIVAKHPAVTQEDYDAAEVKLKTLSPLVIGAATGQATEALFKYIVLIAVAMWLGWTCFLSVLASIVLRRGLLLRLFSVDLVTASGEPASRLRLLGRSWITWSPLVTALLAPAFILPAIQKLETGRSGEDLIYPLAFLFGHAWLCLAIWSALRPRRGLADVVAGTWPVPQ